MKIAGGVIAMVGALGAIFAVIALLVASTVEGYELSSIERWLTWLALGLSIVAFLLGFLATRPRHATLRVCLGLLIVSLIGLASGSLIILTFMGITAFGGLLATIGALLDYRREHTPPR